MALDLTKINLYLEKEKPITLEEISFLKVEDLRKPEVYYRFLVALANPQYKVEAKIALPFIDSLEKNLGKIAKDFPEIEFLEKYQEIIRYLQFFHLYFQKTSVIRDLFENHLLFALKSGVDIKGQLKKSFIFYNYDLIGWTEMRDLIIKAIRENKEKIGAEKIKIKEIELIPIIKNWLLDYEPFRKEGRAIDRANYMAKSENFRRLPEEEKKLLMQVLEIYDYIQFDLNWFIAAAENKFIFLPPRITPKIPRPRMVPSRERLKVRSLTKPPKEPLVKPPPPSPFEKKYLEEEGEKK